jgi:hypothetical protein
MSVPIFTSQYDFYRQDDVEVDGQDESLFELLVSGIRGCTVYHSGTESVTAGQRERVDARIMCDIPDVEIYHYDRIVDTTTDQVWYVSFVRKRVGFGLDHLVCGVYAVTGVARGTRDA